MDNNNNTQLPAIVNTPDEYRRSPIPIVVQPFMERTNMEYFGPEQHNIDMEEIVADQQNPLQILGKFEGDWLNDLKIAVGLAEQCLFTNRAVHPDYLYLTEITDAMPKISKMVELLGFDKLVKAKIQFQRPGCNAPRHRDTDLLPGHIRILVTLAPWEWGQYIFYNNTVFCEWDAGTILWADTRKVWHSTTNTSYHTRPLLAITGAPSLELQELIKSRIFKTFQV